MPYVGDATAEDITGTAAADTISALGGNDTISGGAGNDMIQGNKSMIKVMIGAAGTVVAGLLSTIVVILINVQ